MEVWDAAMGARLGELKNLERGPHYPISVPSVAWCPTAHRDAAAWPKWGVLVCEVDRSRQLAVAMPLDGRLGRGSLLAALDRELLQAIVDLMPVEWGGPQQA